MPSSFLVPVAGPQANRGNSRSALSRSTPWSSALVKPSKVVGLAMLRTTVGSGAAGPVGVPISQFGMCGTLFLQVYRRERQEFLGENLEGGEAKFKSVDKLTR